MKKYCMVLGACVVSFTVILLGVFLLLRTSGPSQCKIAGGSWEEFNNGCADRCATGASPIACTDGFTEGCYCGDDACWDGKQCVRN